ncbi:hypothetical protein BH18ACI1_BH18ACI1_18080 [soil metagenome]
MFCLNCGKADQTENTYCRSCGEFLPDLSKNSSIIFGGSTPQQTANIIGGISLVSSVFSLFVGCWLYITGFNIPIVIYLAAALLICNSIWSASNFLMVQKLAKRLNPNKQKLNSQNEITEDNFSQQKVLPTADLENFLPISVTENTTKHLSEKAKRSSQTE